MATPNDLSEIDDILAQLSGETPKPLAPTPTPAASAVPRGLQPPPAMPPRPKTSSVSPRGPSPALGVQSAPQLSTVPKPAPAPTTGTAPTTAPAHRPTISSLDDYVSNLTNAFQTLDATGGSSTTATDDLSYSLMMLNSPNSREREQALIKIVNVSVEEKGRQEILQKDGARYIAGLLDSSNGLPICRLAAQAVSNLALYDPCREAFGRHGAPQKLVKLLDCNDNELSDKALGALSNLCNNNEPNRVAIGDTLLSRMPQLLTSTPNIVSRALTSITNLVFNENNQRKMVEQATLPSITALLTSPNVEYRSQACWIFAVLSTGPVDVQKSIYDSGALFGLVQTMPRATDVELEKILTVLVNLSNTDDLLQPISNVGGVKYLVDVFKRPNTPLQCRVLAVQALNNLTYSDACTLRIGEVGGADLVVSLLSSSNSSDSSEKLLDSTVRLAINLAVNPTVRKQLNDKNAQEVLSRLSSHSNPGIQSNVTLALQNLRARS